MDTANIAVKVNGLGSYTIQCQCRDAGVSETRIVQIPDPGITTTERHSGLSPFFLLLTKVSICV